MCQKCLTIIAEPLRVHQNLYYIDVKCAREQERKKDIQYNVWNEDSEKNKYK